MKHNKYATIDMDGETNIGVLNLGDLSHIHKDDQAAHFRKNVEPALVEALSAHFDCPVKVSVPMLEAKSYHPIVIEYHVVLETEDEDRRVMVILNETWLY
mgnify:CR=1 FL=1